MENGKQWEQPTVQAGGVSEDGQAGNVAGQVTDPTQAGVEASERMIREAVSTEVQRVLDGLLPTVRQDLTSEVERRVQSFSDRAEHRLSQVQTQKLKMLDEVMEGLKDTLGPDYERIRNQRRVDILAQVPEPQQADQTQSQPSQQAAPAANAQVDNQAGTYLATRLGDQNSWSPAQQQQIYTELAQAQDDLYRWMGVVDKWAALKPQTPAQGTQGIVPGNNGQQSPASTARLQPMGSGSALGNKTIEQLGAELNAAHARSDYEDIARLNKLIDSMVDAETRK